MARTSKLIDPSSDSESGSGSGSDAPESIPLAASKKLTQKRENERQEAETLRKQKEKAKNRERDARLKARAERNREVKEVKGGKGKEEKASKKGKGKEKQAQSDEEEESVDGEDEDEETTALQARMERAMQDAQGESGDENDEDEDENGPTFDEFDGTSSGIEEGSEGDDEDEEDEEDGPIFPDWDSASSGIENGSESDDMEDDDSEDDTHSLPPAKSTPGLFAKAIAKSQKLTPKKTSTSAPKLKIRAATSASYLPDELFAAAFASQAGGSNANPKRKAEDSGTVNDKPPPKKRKNTGKPRDVVVGSRAIRILPNTHSNSLTGAAPPPPPPATLPSRKVKKFLNRTLALKGGKQPSKAWERRPANIGVARRINGPARNFVRNP